jgi:hypothetical protein
MHQMKGLWQYKFTRVFAVTTLLTMVLQDYPYFTLALPLMPRTQVVV